MASREVEVLQAPGAFFIFFYYIFYTGAWQRGREQTCLACHMVGWTPGAGRAVGGETARRDFALVDLSHRFEKKEILFWPCTEISSKEIICSASSVIFMKI